LKHVKFSSGFSLIEVLAALAVTALVIATVLPYFGLLLSRWSTGERSVQMQDQWMQSTMRLSEDLAEAVPLALGPAEQPALAFRLAPFSISFVRPGLGEIGKNLLQTVSFKIERSPQGDSLYRTASDFSPDSFPEHGGSATSLLSGRYHLSFSTFDREGQKVETWPDGPELPVRILLNAEPIATSTNIPPAAIVLPIPARFSPRQALQANLTANQPNPPAQAPSVNPNGKAAE
jgi:prepilin-type N-terminal cleavage/methylation domain-containing protein